MALFTLLVLMIISEACAQSFANKYRHDNNICTYITACLFYAAVVYFMSNAHKYEKISVVNGMMSAISVVSMTIVGTVFFNEVLSTKQILSLGACALLITTMPSAEPVP
jgi:multidrug transporter EmrE-like cation transporter